AMQTAGRDADDPALQTVLPLQGKHGAAGIVAPIARLPAGYVVEGELDLAGELQAAEPHPSAVRGGVGEEHALVNRHRGHGTELMVDVGPKRTDPVWGAHDPDVVRRSTVAPDQLVSERRDRIAVRGH